MTVNNDLPNKGQDQANKSRVDAPQAKPTDKSLDRGLQNKERIQQGQKTTR